MSELSSKNSVRVSLPVLVLLVVTMALPVVAEKPKEKTDSPAQPLLAVKPIPDHGPTPLASALKFAQLDAKKAATQAAVQVKAVEAISQKWKSADDEIKRIQKRFRKRNRISRLIPIP